MTSTTQNTPATIESTVETSLRTAGYSTYLRQAQPVVDALVAREQAICEKLLDFASENGAETDEVTELLTSLGLSLKPEEPETVPAGFAGEQTDVATALASIQRSLEGLTAFARQNGYRGN